MPNALIEKLRSYAALPDEDAALLDAECRSASNLPARHGLFREGDEPGPICVMLSGWACRYKTLPDGSRRITAFLMPGDCCGMYSAMPRV